MQTQANITAAPVCRPVCVETTALGAAYLAGLAVGYWKNQEEIQRNWTVDRSFTPDISQQEREKMLSGWRKAVSCCAGWEKE